MLATLDHFSNGRVILGAGVGWMEEEITLLGAPFSRRGAWSDEAIRIMRACWSQEKDKALGLTTLLLESCQRDLDDMIRIHETFARKIRPAV